VIRLAVLLYVKYPLSFRNVEHLVSERGIDISHETVRYWWNQFGPLLAADIRRQRVSRELGFRQPRWHLDEMFVKVNGGMPYLWRAVDHEGEVLESFVTKDRDKAAALKFMKKALKPQRSPEVITTDGLRSCKAAMNVLGNRQKQEVGCWANNRVASPPTRRLVRVSLTAPSSLAEAAKGLASGPADAPAISNERRREFSPPASMAQIVWRFSAQGLLSRFVPAS
jgi:putative transposase